VLYTLYSQPPPPGAEHQLLEDEVKHQLGSFLPPTTLKGLNAEAPGHPDLADISCYRPLHEKGGAACRHAPAAERLPSL
jgi:hypothetical protein